MPIATRADYRAYVEADRIALNRSRTIAGWLSDEVWRYERRLRRYEYTLNTGKRVRAMWAYFRVTRLGNRLGFTIAPNVFGPGLSIAHPGTVSINQHARVGQNCRISANVTIGADYYRGDEAPTLGDDCFIGPGASILGRITLGNGTKVGANAVVIRSFTADGLTLVGVPAKAIQGR